jgi:hypothetical protein
MAASKNERNRILSLVEGGQVSAEQAAQLLDALDIETVRPLSRGTDRMLRVRMTNVNAKAPTVHLTASLPVRLLTMSVQLGVRLFPQLENHTLAEILQTIEQGAKGRLLDLQDLEHGERLEIFVD